MDLPESIWNRMLSKHFSARKAEDFKEVFVCLLNDSLCIDCWKYSKTYNLSERNKAIEWNEKYSLKIDLKPDAITQWAFFRLPG